MAQRATYLTPEGLLKLEAELEELRTRRRREVAEQIRKGAEVGGTVDNAEYDEAKREQGRIEGRIMDLESLINSAVVIDVEKGPTRIVHLGSTVTVTSSKGLKEKYTIVGSTEVDPPSGRISNESPVGKALLGKKVGDEVDVRTPAGVTHFKVARVE